MVKKAFGVSDHWDGCCPRCGSRGSGESQLWLLGCSFTHLPLAASHFLLKWRERKPQSAGEYATSALPSYFIFLNSHCLSPTITITTGITQRTAEGNRGKHKCALTSASGSAQVWLKIVQRNNNSSKFKVQGA